LQGIVLVVIMKYSTSQRRIEIKIIDVGVLDMETLTYLYGTKQIKFLEKYEIKFLTLLAKSKNE
jgi:hypothetical protein